MVVCTNCGNQAGEGAVFCDQCGARLPGPEAAAPAPAATPTGGSVICTACGAGNVPGEAFCDYCGSPLEAPVPTAEAVPELEPVSTEAELEVAPEPVVEEEAQPEPGLAEVRPARDEATEEADGLRGVPLASRLAGRVEVVPRRRRARGRDRGARGEEEQRRQRGVALHADDDRREAARRKAHSRRVRP